MLSNLSWNHCGCEANKLTGAVQVIKSSNITVTNCVFTLSNNIGLVLMSTGDSIRVVSTVFSKNEAIDINTLSVGLYVWSNTSNTVYNIDSCIFEHNSNTAIQTSAKGGGLYIGIGTGASNISINITNCTFNTNQAMLGGGAYIDLPAITINNAVALSNCLFSSNVAKILGGGLYFGVTSLHLPRYLNYQFSLKNCAFYDNSATHAGGWAYQIIGQQSQDFEASMTIVLSRFHNNIANESGAAIGIFKWEAGLGGTAPIIMLTSCNITNNSAYGGSNDISSPVGSGIVYSQGVPISFSGTSNISNNIGTGILASSCSIYMYDEVIMEKNNGVRGGAVQLISGSRIVVGEHLELIFRQNHAKLFGGAIYHVFPVLGVIGQNRYCTFQYFNESITNPQLWNAMISFESNTAQESGLSVYLSSPDSCRLNENGLIFTEQAYHFLPNYTSQVSTPPVAVTFSNVPASNKIDCSQEYCSASVMLGEELKLIATAYDEFNQPVHGFALVNIDCIDKACDYYTLGGNNLISLTGSDVHVGFYIKGNYNISNSDILLRWQLIEQPTTVAHLHIHIRKCYLGYVYDSNLKICTCSQSDSIVCNVNNSYTACIQHGYWYGEVMIDDDGTPRYAALSCPLGSCNFTGEAGCPTKRCGSDGSPYYFYCTLPQDDSDELCLFNKGGTLCSYCRNNYSFSMTNIECIPSDKCSSGYIKGVEKKTSPTVS